MPDFSLMIKHFIHNIKNSQLSKDILYVFLGQIAIMLSVFGINKIVSYYMGVESFAVYNLIKRAGGLLACVVSGGLTIALPRYLARHTSSSTFDRAIASSLTEASILIVLIYGLIVTTICFLFPSQFNYLFFQSNEINYSLILVVVVFALGQAYSNLLFSYYQGIGNFKKYNIAQFICSSLCLIFAYIFRSNLYTFVLTSYLALLIIGLCPMLYLKGRNSKKGTSDNRIKRIDTIVRSKLLKYGTPRLLHDLMLFAQDVIPLIIILHRFDIHIVGLYSAGLSIPLTISPMFAFTGGVFLQRVSLLVKQNDWKAINKMINIALIIFTAIAIVGTLILILTKEFIVTLMFSSEFNEVIPLVPYFALSLLPRAIYLLYRNPLDAVSERPYNLYITTLRTALLILFLFWGKSTIDCAKAYLYSSIVMAILPLIIWNKLKKNEV